MQRNFLIRVIFGRYIERTWFGLFLFLNIYYHRYKEESRSLSLAEPIFQAAEFF
jgi:hypothetical protein